MSHYLISLNLDPLILDPDSDMTGSRSHFTSRGYFWGLTAAALTLMNKEDKK